MGQSIDSSYIKQSSLIYGRSQCDQMSFVK
jgi:hypothetical protein